MRYGVHNCLIYAFNRQRLEIATFEGAAPDARSARNRAHRWRNSCPTCWTPRRPARTCPFEASRSLARTTPPNGWPKGLPISIGRCSDRGNDAIEGGADFVVLQNSNVMASKGIAKHVAGMRTLIRRWEADIDRAVEHHIDDAERTQGQMRTFLDMLAKEE